jgi:hypothetical protein
MRVPRTVNSRLSRESWEISLFPRLIEIPRNPQKLNEMHENVKNTYVYLQRVAELMSTTVRVLMNYCNNVNNRKYNGFQWTVIMFYCCKCQQLQQLVYVNTLNNVTVVFIPLFLHVLTFTTTF